MWRIGGFNIVEWVGDTLRGPINFPFEIEIPGETQPLLDDIIAAALEAYYRFIGEIEERYPGKMKKYGDVISTQVSFLTFHF